MNRNTKIELTDTPMSALMKLCGGNPGALTACMKMMQASPSIDPDSFLASIGPLLSLDGHGIYKERIWMLYSDVCHRNVVWALALLRAVQLGLVTEQQMNTAIDNYGRGLDMEAVLAAVQKRLPKFNAPIDDGSHAGAITTQP